MFYMLQAYEVVYETFATLLWMFVFSMACVVLVLILRSRDVRSLPSTEIVLLFLDIPQMAYEIWEDLLWDWFPLSLVFLAGFYVAISLTRRLLECGDVVCP